MSPFASAHFLRNVLFADAASCLGCGALQLLFTERLSHWFHLPTTLLVGTGVFLLAYAAAVLIAATREPVPRGFVALLVPGNLAWAVGCVALLGTGAVAPTALGTAWVLVQAVTVAVLAGLQWLGLRRAPRREAWA